MHGPAGGGAENGLFLIVACVSVLICCSHAALPHLKSERLRALAVGGGQRSPLLPETPTIKPEDYNDPNKYPALLQNSQADYSKVNWDLVKDQSVVPPERISQIPPGDVNVLQVSDKTRLTSTQLAGLQEGVPNIQRFNDLNVLNPVELNKALNSLHGTNVKFTFAGVQGVRYQDGHLINPAFKCDTKAPCGLDLTSIGGLPISGIAATTDPTKGVNGFVIVTDQALAVSGDQLELRKRDLGPAGVRARLVALPVALDAAPVHGAS